MECWKGRVALVTGAGAGIGAAITTALLRHGVNVVGVARRAHKIEELATPDCKGELHALQGDMRKEEDILNVFQWIKDKYGCADILVNNAGIFSDVALTEMTTEDMCRVVEVNLVGLSVSTREAVSLMEQKAVRDGHVIHIGSSLAMQFPQASEGAFSTGTKHAVRCLAEGLRKDIASRGSHIRVTVVNPGVTETEVFEELKHFSRERVLSKPHLKPSDVADAVLYALSAPSHVQVKEIVIEAVGQGSAAEW